MRDYVKIYEAGMSMFLLAVEKAIKEGYSLDMTDNEGIPQAYGSFYECTLYKDAKEVAKEPAKVQQVVDNTPKVEEVKVATEDVVATSTEAKVDAPSAIANARVGRPRKGVVIPPAAEGTA